MIIFNSTTFLECSAIKRNVKYIYIKPSVIDDLLGAMQGHHLRLFRSWVFVYLQNTTQIREAHSIVYLRGWRARGKQVLSAKTRTMHQNETAVTLLKTVKLCAAAVGFGDS